MLGLLKDLLSCSAKTQQADAIDAMLPPSYHQAVAPAAPLRPRDSPSSLSSLRNLMQEHKMNYYLISTNDPHASEFVGAQDRRLSFFSGFSGDTGTAVIGQDAAWLFVDGRFWTQARSEVDSQWTIMRVGAPGVPDWIRFLSEHCTHSERIGLCASLFTYDTVTSLRQQVSPKDVQLAFAPEDQDLVDQLWHDRPNKTANPVVEHDLKLAGQPASEKLAHVRTDIARQGCLAYLASELAEVAWLLNLRGSDIENCPTFYSYLLVTEFGSTFFIENKQISSPILRYLQDLKVDVKPYASVTEALKLTEWPKPCLMSGSTPYFLAGAVGEKHIRIAPSPVIKSRSIKNKAEIAAMRSAYLTDAVAWVRWIAELEERLASGEKVSEFDAADSLIRYCAKSKDFFSQSYEPAYQNGPNGAKPHYFPPAHGSPIIDTRALTVVDIGCQYRTGTTDTTRTFHYQPKRASAEEKRAFTRVLQGHAAVDAAIFPKGTTGSQIDVLARAPMWQDGRNYTHGTGHGIGAFLNVHEWPGIVPGYTTEPLVAGQIFSNEPGYYVEGKFGARLESAVLVKEVSTDVDFGDGWFAFERLTQIPIQANLVDYSMLNDKEKQWLSDHNEAAKKAVLPLLGDDKRAIKWLKRQ